MLIHHRLAPSNGWYLNFTSLEGRGVGGVITGEVAFIRDWAFIKIRYIWFAERIIHKTVILNYPKNVCVCGHIWASVIFQSFFSHFGLQSFAVIFSSKK